MSLTQNRIRARRLNSVWAMKQRRRVCPHQYFTRIELGTTGVIAGIYHEAKKTCLRRSAAAGPSGGCSRRRLKSGSYVSARMAEAGLHADVRCAARGRALGSAERQKRKNERHIVGVTREGKSMLSDGRHVWCVASGFGNENLMRRKGN